MAEFYLDHNVARELGYFLRREGHSARTVQQLGLVRAGDEIHLSLAAQSGWTLITHNARDFTLLHAAWLRWSRDWNVEAEHAGILVLAPPVSPRRAMEEVLALAASEEGLRGALWIWREQSGWVRRS